MSTGDQTNRGSKFGDGPGAQARGPDPDGLETEPAQAIPESDTILGGVDADRDVAAQPAGGGAGTAEAADLAEFSRALVEIGLIDAEGLDEFAVDPDEGVLGLSRALIKAGKLTAYQAAAVSRRKTKGLSIGNYLILDKLGAGGMGVVFQARHRKLGRVVALKILPPSSARDRTAVLRFRREVAATGRLKHPNLVAALDADEDRGVHFLVMDYVEGRDLSRAVLERGPMPVAQALDCLIQAARGLEAAHVRRGSSTATSSRATSYWTPRGRCGCSTWAWCGSSMRPTPRPSRPPVA